MWCVTLERIFVEKSFVFLILFNFKIQMALKSHAYVFLTDMFVAGTAE